MLSHKEIADALALAARTGEAIAPPSLLHPELALADAYEIQRINARREYEAGAVHIGHKVGLTSAAMQAQLGVEQPDFGVLTDRMLVPNGGRLVVEGLLSLRIEVELGFWLAHDLRGDDLSLDDVREAVAGVSLALEIIDSRVRDWRIGLADTVADNASSARVVIGPERTATPELLKSLPGMVLCLERDGATVAKGAGAEVLGDPLAAVLWLVRMLSGFDAGLRAGDFVLAGAVHASVPLAAGTTWSVSTADAFRSAVLHTS